MMRVPPLDVGAIHFVGIGGIGMSGIAEVLRNLGYAVQGSDLADSASVKRLREQGIRVAQGHDAANLAQASVVVVSSAVEADNVELVEARRRRLPVVRRADMLAELMRLRRSVAVAGTHGKTTTTAIVAALLDAANLDPTVINGGIINAYGTNARLGQGEWLIAEADESDGSFLRLPSTIGIVTNIDPEHMEFWDSFDTVRDAYVQFVERLPFYGLGVLCIDHPEVRALMSRITDRRLVTYGFSPQADIRAVNAVLDATGSIFDVELRDPHNGCTQQLDRLQLSLPGRHNITNALAAIAVARELQLPEASWRRGLAGLRGVRRRFTVTGELDGITIIDDYGHHPVEIRAVLETARAAARSRVIAVVQPHRYTRLRDLFDEFCTCFADADDVLVAPVYAAGEPPIEGITHIALAEGLKAHGQRRVELVDGFNQVLSRIDGTARDGDLVIFLGAGSITQWANSLPGKLMECRAGASKR